MRRWVLSILILIALAAGAFFALAPGLIEKDLNKIDGKPLPQVSARAQALHKTLTIVDLHSDSLLSGTLLDSSKASLGIVLGVVVPRLMADVKAALA